MAYIFDTSQLISTKSFTTVSTYADLPTPNSVPGAIYFVTTGSGIYFINRKSPGAYYSNGASWIYLGEVVPYFDSANFQIYDNSDTTRSLNFDVSAISTGTTRTITMPDADVDLGNITAAAAGNSTEVQYNNGGILGADSRFTFSSTTKITTIDNLQFNITPTVNTPVTGLNYWDTANHTLSTVLENGVILQNGQELHIYGKNTSGSIIANGQPVSVIQNNGQFTAFGSVDITTAAAYAFVGLATQQIAINGFGYVTIRGVVRDIDTSALDEGKPVYVSPSGGLTKTFPSVPNYIVNVGIVEYKHVSEGRINVIPAIVPKMQDLSDVNGTALTTTGQLPVWNNTGKYFDFDYNLTNYELLANKKTTLGTSDTYYPTQKAATQPWVDINRYGFLNQTETTISFNDSTYTFTLAAAGSGWSYYRAGLKYTITGNKTVVLPGTPPTAATYFIYIDATDGTLSQSTTPWTLNDTKVPVAIISWNDALTPKYLMYEERHSCLCDRRDHLYKHATIGTRVSSVGALTGYTPNTDNNAAKTFAVAQSEIFDEDIKLTLAALTDPNGTATDYTVFYRTALTTWAWKKSNMPFVYNVGNTNDWIQWDNAGTMTDATGGAGGATRWLNSYLLLTNEQTSSARFAIVPGRAIFTSLAAAQAEDFSTFSITGMPFVEAVAVYQLTWTTVTSTSQGKCRLAVDPKRISTNIVQTTGAVAGTDHNSLSNLQGGTAGEYYHLTAAQATVVGNTSGTNTGDVTLATDSGLALSGQVLNMGTPSTLTSSTTNSVTTNTHAHAITTGIAQNNIVKVSASDVANGEFAKFTATGLESRTTAEVLSDIGAAASIYTPNDQSGTTYTINSTDLNKLVNFSSGSAVTVTVDTNANQPFTIGARVDCVQSGAGKVTFQAAGGVTLNSKGGVKSIGAQYVGVTLVKVAADSWILFGDLIA